MSASRDPSQKFTFVYSNLHYLYKKGKEAAQAANIPEPTRADMTRGIMTGRIIKADDLNREKPVVVSGHQAPHFIRKKIDLNRPMRMSPEREGAIQGLRDNLKQLKSLQERLHFMLKELEDLSKE